METNERNRKGRFAKGALVMGVLILAAVAMMPAASAQTQDSGGGIQRTVLRTVNDVVERVNGLCLTCYDLPKPPLPPGPGPIGDILHEVEEIAGGCLSCYDLPKPPIPPGPGPIGDEVNAVKAKVMAIVYAVLQRSPV